jgi:uncharacterized protein with PIN domain
MDRDMVCPYCNKAIGKLPLKTCMESKATATVQGRSIGEVRDIRCKKCGQLFDALLTGLVTCYKKGEI